ncbi:MAG: hypothetical protein WA988_06950 [Candidatus Nanopelagicales bacterium]
MFILCNKRASLTIRAQAGVGCDDPNLGATLFGAPSHGNFFQVLDFVISDLAILVAFLPVRADQKSVGSWRNDELISCDGLGNA